MELYFRKLGDNGQPLIILHGLFGMSDNWLTISKTFAEHFQVYLVDLRNHGQSPRSDEFGYDSMANDIADFISKHNLTDVNLIGHSMGGKVLMVFADKFPDLFNKIIIVDIAPRFYPVHHHMILQGLHSIDLPTLKSRTEANEILKRFEESEGVRQFLLKNLYRNPETGTFDWRLNLKVLTKEISQIGEEQYPKQPITKPVLFIAGAESSYITAADEAEIKKHYTHVSFCTIQEAGHWVQADQPVAFVNEAFKFLL